MTFTIPKITELNYVEVANKAFEELRRNPPDNHAHMLPLLFNLNGRPFTLENHFQMRPLFSATLPTDITYKTGRQISKTTTNGAESILFGFVNPFHNILHVAPLYVHIERFSNDYVAPLLEHSPVRSCLVTKQSKRAMLQRSLKNGSNLIFTFAYHDCTRVRGISANLLKYDEYQDLDPAFEPIINQTLAAANMKSLAVNPDKASQPGIMRFGTPLTLDNGLEQAWSRSSQAEWCIVCRKCKHDNIPAREYDLDKMMGPKTRKTKVTTETPGLVCAKCGHFLYTRDGRWVHMFPEREHIHAGYHIPQCIMTFHCENDAAWTKLQQYRFNQNIMSVAKFYNEICGESYDHGQKLISVTNLRNAATLPPKTDFRTHLQLIQGGRYVDWGVGIDWGGGGQSEDSKTAFALAGLRADGIVEVFTGYRSNTPNDFNLEAARTLDICRTFQVKFAAMDFNGTGNALRRSKLIDHGYPAKLIYPVFYANVKEIAKVVPAQKDAPTQIQVNKARSFLYLSQLIKSLRIRFFEYDYKSPEEQGLLRDFTALVEEKVEMKSVGDVYRVIRSATAGPDDFAQAVNYAVCALFVRRGAFPDAGSIMTIGDLTPDQQKAIEPALKDKDFNWFFEET